MTENKFEYCKPEDWEEFASAYPEASTFLKERAQYRQYLELRLVLYATTGDQRELVERKLADLEAEIVSWPYLKPRPQPPAPPPATTSPWEHMNGIYEGLNMRDGDYLDPQPPYNVLDGGTHKAGYEPHYETTPPLDTPEMNFLLSCTNGEQWNIIRNAYLHLAEMNDHTEVPLYEKIRQYIMHIQGK